MYLVLSILQWFVSFNPIPLFLPLTSFLVTTSFIFYDSVSILHSISFCVVFWASHINDLLFAYLFALWRLITKLFRARCIFCIWKTIIHIFLKNWELSRHNSWNPSFSGVRANWIPHWAGIPAGRNTWNSWAAVLDGSNFRICCPYSFKT